MKKIHGGSRRAIRIVPILAPLVILIVAGVASLRGQGQNSSRGIVTPLASANLVFDGEPACLKVARENVLTGMDGMAEAALGPGGFAMMPSKAMHWFTCKSKDTCLMFVTFDRKYDIVWAKPQK
jgi:hypothetical protein